MKTSHIIPALVTLCGGVFAQKVAPTQDAPGTKDYPGTPRYEGSTIMIQSSQKFGELGLQIAGLSTGKSTDPKEVRKIEGRTHRTTYLFLNLGKGKRSTLEIARNYEAAFKESGFAVIWSGGQTEVRNGPPQQYYAVPELDHQLLTTGMKDRRYFCLEKGGLFVAVFIASRSWEHVMNEKSDANPWKTKVTIPEESVIIQVDYVDTRPMEEKMIRVPEAAPRGTQK